MIETKVNVEGMACEMCESHINSAIRNNFDVKKVTSSRKKNETVVLSEEPLDEEKVEKVITDLGYYYKGMQSKTVEEKRGFHLFKH
ncbi:MAG: heavy metal-associated domain-containing protein [Erysipelotrichia bacterium]|nr:heavy metal-associated domain-containing protein [Erysipelotrichia bacterium]